MAASAGYLATLTIGGQAIHNIDNFDLPFKMDNDETTSFSATAPGAKTYQMTLYGMSFKVAGRWDLADTAQQALEDAFFNRTTVAVIASPGNSKTYTLSAFITDYPIKAAVGTLVTVEFGLLMTGAVVRA